MLDEAEEKLAEVNKANAEPHHYMFVAPTSLVKRSRSLQTSSSPDLEVAVTTESTGNFTQTYTTQHLKQMKEVR